MFFIVWPEVYTFSMAKSSKQSRITVAQPAHFQERIASLQKRLKKAGVSALLVTNRKDIRYLTGFVGDDSWALVRTGSKQVHVLSDFRFEEQIRNEAPHVKAIMRQKSLADALKDLIEPLKLERIGLQVDHTTLAQRKTLAKAVGTRRLADLEDGLLAQRAIKDEDEVNRIRKALDIQQKAYLKTIATIKSGQSEFQIAGLLEYNMRSLGADGVSFPSIVAADANGSLPHAIPGQTKTRKGGSLLIDWGARYQGYCGDLTRVIGLGGMSAKMREIYQIVLDAQLAAIEAIGPGKAMKEIDAVARDYITRAGYGEAFGHSLGHGVGLDIHEQPTLSTRSEGGLQPGHVVTVEPGIYLPGVGGVRIEDVVLVTERGGQVLSRLPKDLKSAMI